MMRRKRALAAILDGLPDPPELPPEAEDTSNTGSGNACEPVTIHQDGRTLHGGSWVKPQDFAEAEVERGDLASLKGATPETLPVLDPPQQD